MKFLLEISIDNDAFGDEPSAEIGRILRGAAREVCETWDADTSPTHLHDINGNRVGFYCLSTKRLSQ